MFTLIGKMYAGGPNPNEIEVNIVPCSFGTSSWFINSTTISGMYNNTSYYIAVGAREFIWEYSSTSTINPNALNITSFAVPQSPDLYQIQDVNTNLCLELMERCDYYARFTTCTGYRYPQLWNFTKV
ncbi:hypothetical protein PPL_10422 [Heterostelium album PN500]|uniref:Uncharacterized protein n=1 Tax=Heterostelium pallidum (strain ATCC 26659 / Pp 5 / PN500) TaxID=670386 RepID=D3BR19_HETP5|nr:hypothetical protein PPL_10422 [Heterostelium album PN500]EFA75851.1 hypothetical protein PPL_10422 [Heterostelium album PN500]|eukprot:XP_020427985.1 hypothetical protein PPL_10422 [Heterostelium album PN500]